MKEQVDKRQRQKEEEFCHKHFLYLISELFPPLYALMLLNVGKIECNFETISDYASTSRSLICAVWCMRWQCQTFSSMLVGSFSDFHLHTIRDCTWIFPATDLCVGSDEASLKLAEKKFRAHNWNTIHDHGRPPWTPSVGSISKSDSSWITQGTQKRLKIDRLPAIESLGAACIVRQLFFSYLILFAFN